MIYTKSKNTYFATPKDNPKDKISLEVGDSKQPDFKPQQKIMRWDNEVNVSLRLVHDEVSPTVSKSGEKITWEGKKVKAEIYPLTEGEGGQEFEITLKEKPKSNVVQFTLVDKGVEYFKQTEERKQFKDGSWNCEENVPGSYAIYASENKINYFGGKEYKCGKVGHIFRPKIIDSVGIEVWGDLHIENGILSVTIPQAFLDKAVYPVRHAAGLTFGYTTAGALQEIMYWDRWIARIGTVTDSGTVDSISAYILGSNSGTYFKGLLNNSSSPFTLLSVANATLMPYPTINWRTSSFSSPPNVTADTNYFVGIVSNNSYNHGYVSN